MEKYLEYLKGRIICRNNVIKQLYSLIGYLDEPMPYSIFVYGHVATGKSLVVQNMLSFLKYNTAIINCIEHVNSKHIFNYILNDLSSNSNKIAVSAKLQHKCDNIVDFVTNLREISMNDTRPIMIVFDKCEKLRDIDSNLLPMFSRLQELSKINVCVIFISELVWEKFRVKIGSYEPIKIHFSQYMQNEFSKILLKYKSCNYEDTFYKNYVNLFLSVFLRFCRDLNELRYMAKINFSKYIQPIETDESKKDDTAMLWRNISTVFKTNLELIYLRVSSEDFSKHSQLSKEIESTTKLALSFELPYYAKYILIASYLASYNPAKEDKHLFMKQKVKRKRKNVVKKTASKFGVNCGPHNFPISRMLAIFCTILDEKVDINASLLAQIPSMCQLGLLSFVGNYSLDESKLKCCVSYDFILVIAKTVGFTIQNYIHSFTH
ncbi:PREDICTED: origin recognition complex subunit 5 [Dufourea novaeangliae]|uniref:origin recognition complex subunit 5 n=1 Tax=Dufourea novaeangliae TaxID=178035 RepID=UPI0007678734|nr:PREDICTED: origin recognition complex subunit 5 [Dufourea novaeangliae]